MKNEVRIGIVGGSGLYQMEGLTDVEEVSLDTPFGLVLHFSLASVWGLPCVGFIGCISSARTRLARQ